MRKILVTSALPYANGSIHLGHLVEYIQTDIWCRYQRMIANEVYYVCADDTHGTPVMLRAEKENITPEKLVELVHKEHSQDFADFNVSFDNFYSTNSIENKELSESIYKKLFTLHNFLFLFRGIRIGPLDSSCLLRTPIFLGVWEKHR